MGGLGSRVGRSSEDMEQVNNMATTSEFKLFKPTGLVLLKKKNVQKRAAGQCRVFLKGSNSPRRFNSQLPPNRKQCTV